MSFISNINKSNWNDSMHIFFSPKLSLEGKNLLPHIFDTNFSHKQQNFLTVLKKPITNTLDKIGQKKQKKQAVLVIGQAKQPQKRNQTTQNKRRHISVQFQQTSMINYRQTINQVSNYHNLHQRKALLSQKPQSIKQKKQKQKYYFYVGPGNNSQLVEQIMEKRCFWEKTTSTLHHFRWEQARPKYANNPINKMLVNHLPNHQVITDKVGLVNSLKSYCQKNQQQMFNIIPACFFFDFQNIEACQNQIKKFIQFYFQETERAEKGSSELLQQQINSSKYQKSLIVSSRKIIKNQSNPSFANQSLNSPNKNFRSTKKQIQSPSSYQSNKKKQQIRSLHRTLLSKFKQFYNFVDMSPPKKQAPYSVPIHYSVYGNTCLWLLKPSDLNRGRGIHLFRTIQQLGDLLKNQLVKNEKGSFLVQKYIERPMLINSRKFDIRVYSMVTQNKQLFFFKEGYIRTSSCLFDVNSKNYFTHLTNNAVQKYSKTYGQFQQGNILPLHYLFRQCGMDKKKVYTEIKNKIKICTKAGFSKIFNFVQKLPIVGSSSVSGNSNSNNLASNNNKTKYFQIFGYDFMLDETGHIWLIQVNTNPCIQLSNQWLKCIIPRMLDDAFKLTVDRVFTKNKQVKDNPQSQKFYSVPQYQDSTSMWQFLDLRAQHDLMVSSSVIP